MDEVTLFQLHVVKYKRLAASSYIPTPKELAGTRSILNIQNKDNKCIVWSILAHFHPIDSKLHAARVTNYLSYKHEINVNGVSFPTPLKDVGKLERQNDISINVFGYDKEEKVYPMYKTK